MACIPISFSHTKVYRLTRCRTTDDYYVNQTVQIVFLNLNIIKHFIALYNTIQLKSIHFIAILYHNIANF